MAEKCIELRHISKSFDGEKILDSLNLDIRENEFVTLFGTQWLRQDHHAEDHGGVCNAG